MSSQLNVDTIVDKAGSGGSNVKMANTSTYVSDGGNVTQNTVQGLAKAFIFSNQATAAKSFNMSATTDSGTGDFTFSITNNMEDANWMHMHNAGLESETYGLYLEKNLSDGSKTTGTIRFLTMSISNSVQDASNIQQVCFGDLA